MEEQYNDTIQPEGKSADQTPPVGTQTNDTVSFAPQSSYPMAGNPLPARRQRRVGTFTLGLSLILIGILVIAALFTQGRALEWFRYAPVVLIFLGVEILIYAVCFRNEKLKYDGLSIFLVIVITVFSIVGAVVGPILSNAVKFDQAVRERRTEVFDTVQNGLDELAYSAEVYVYPSEYGSYYEIQRFDATGKVEAQINIDLIDIGAKPADKGEMANAFLKIAQKVIPIENISLLNIEYTPVDAKEHYSVHLSAADLKRLDAHIVERRTAQYRNSDYYENDSDDVTIEY